MMIADLPFREVWAVDFEFSAPDGERPKPICLVARELQTGRLVRQWEDEFGPLPPYSIGPDSLFVAFYASAEFGCHLALNWPMPERVLDLFAEHRCLTNGIPTGYGNGLLGALAYYGLDGLGAEEKGEMRALALRGGPWTAEEHLDLLDYCESDVVALARLLPAILPRIDLPRALLRGRYMVAAARMEWNGVPIDVGTLARLKLYWHDIQDRLISEIDTDYGVFEGRTFKPNRFAAWLDRTGIPWPRLESGALDLSDDTFREMSKSFAVARASTLPIRDASERLDCRLRRSEPMSAVRVRHTDGTQRTEQHTVHLRSERLASRSYPSAAGACRRLHRLVGAGDRHCGRAVWRPCYAGRLRVGRPLYCVRQAGWCRARGRYQGIAPGHPRAV
jgi:hypothetical protein